MRVVFGVLRWFLLCIFWAEADQAHHSLETLALWEKLASARSDLTAYGLSRPQQMDLNVSMGLGFHCGQFDPAISVKNTLNQFGKGLQNVANEVVSQATAAIVSFPMYKLAQANPKLYNLLNHNFIAAQQQFAIAMKTCQQMESEALKGNNPYLEWAQISRHNTLAKAQNQNGEKDLQLALNQVDQKAGVEGVPWVTGKPGQAAGGVKQPPIWVVRDVAQAGFRALYPQDTASSSSLWRSEVEAAEWVVSVVGDQMITTCAGCVKGSKTPRGLYYDIDEQKKKIALQMKERVAHFAPGNFTDHASLEQPYYDMTPSMMESVRHFDVNNQYSIIEALSEHMAIRQALKKALLAKRLLKAGSYLPEALAIPDVQKRISLALEFLDSEVNDVLRTFEIKHALFNAPMNDILNLDQSLMDQAHLPGGSEHLPLVRGARIKEV